MVERVRDRFNLSERRACRALGHPRSTQRYKRRICDDEELLVEKIVELATEYGRYGYRRISAMLRADGWQVNHKRVERLRHQEGLKVPKRQPKRRRLWLNDGSSVRLRPECKNHVWSYDFVKDRTSDGRAIRILTVIDEFSRECLAIEIARNIKSSDVVFCLADLRIRPHSSLGYRPPAPEAMDPNILPDAKTIAPKALGLI